MLEGTPVGPLLIEREGLLPAGQVTINLCELSIIVSSGERGVSAVRKAAFKCLKYYSDTEEVSASILFEPSCMVCLAI